MDCEQIKKKSKGYPRSTDLPTPAGSLGRVSPRLLFIKLEVSAARRVFLRSPAGSPLELS